MKKFIWALALCLTFASYAQADLIFSAVSDGTNSGGNPKAIKLEATVNIADLSNYWILRDTNGSSGGTFTISSDYQLPSVSLGVGDCFILYGTAASEAFGQDKGNTSQTVLNGIANHNGDDIFAISTSDQAADVIDAFGLLGQGDTNFAQDSIAVRANPTPNPTGVQDAGNFTISSYSDELYCEHFVVTAAIPEPASAVIFGLAGFGLCVVRRRS